MTSARAFRGVMLVCVIWLSAFASTLPALAQNTVGVIRVEICSKRDPNYPRQIGVLKEMNDYKFVVDTAGGEFSLLRDDFVVCSSFQVMEQRQCPAGQMPGTTGCACPANQTMRNGVCAAADPVVEIPRGQRLTPCASEEKLTIQGSSTVGLGVMPALIKGFAAANSFAVATGVEDSEGKRTVFQLRPADREARCFVITVLSTGSNSARTAITEKAAQMGMSSRDYKDEEIAELDRAGDKQPYQRSDIERVVALDAVAIVVNRRNPIPSLGLCQVAEIFAGKKRNWRDVGHQGPIHVHVTTEGPGIQNAQSGTFETFKTLVMETCHVTIASDAILHDTYPDLLKAVAADEAGIGFAPHVLVDGSVSTLHIGGSCGIQQAITSFSVKSEDYPLSRRLYVFRPVRLTGYARLFENYIVADARAEDAVNAMSSAIDQKIETLADHHAGSVSNSDTAADPKSLRAFNAAAERGQRLSIDYRFAFGSDDLDTKARQDILRLAGFLQSLEKPPRGVLLAGFTDNVGGVGPNVELAERRARKVKQALSEVLPEAISRKIQTAGYGKILPVNCNDDDLGKAKNRRVEAFLLP